MLVGLGAISCAVGPNYRKTEPSAPANWSRLEAKATTVTNASNLGDLSQWWRRLNDPLLSELVDEAQKQSLDLRKTQARLRETRARLGVAGAGRYPSVGASVSASRTGSITGSSSPAGSSAVFAGSQFDAGFDASWELDLFGGVRRGVEAARADQESARANVDDARVSLVAEVASNYVQVRSLQSRCEIARNNLSSQSETLELTELRAQAGLVSTQDVEQARSNREQTLAQIPNLETSLAEAEHRLDILLGKVPDEVKRPAPQATKVAV